MANGSQAINQEILRLKNIPFEVPEVTFEKTNNQVDCLGQLLNPSAAGHSIDNYWTRTLVFAKLFAQKIEESAAIYQSGKMLQNYLFFPYLIVHALQHYHQLKYFLIRQKPNCI